MSAKKILDHKSSQSVSHPEPPRIDLSKQYIIPMCKRGQFAEDCVYKRVVLHPHYGVHKGKQRLDFIRVTCAESSEYEPLGFYPEYFDYLLNVKHYIKIEIPKENEKEVADI